MQLHCTVWLEPPRPGRPTELASAPPPRSNTPHSVAQGGDGDRRPGDDAAQAYSASALLHYVMDEPPPPMAEPPTATVTEAAAIAGLDAAAAAIAGLQAGQPQSLTVPPPPLPGGVEAALRTMRRGERARVSLRPRATASTSASAAAADTAEERGTAAGAAANDDEEQGGLVGYPPGHRHHGATLVVELHLVDFTNPTSVMLMEPAEELRMATVARVR
eukprot:COSAG01_NODE_122_length_25212_cov_25.945646_14_plen_218_part_00